MVRITHANLKDLEDLTKRLTKEVLPLVIFNKIPSEFNTMPGAQRRMRVEEIIDELKEQTETWHKMIDTKKYPLRLKITVYRQRPGQYSNVTFSNIASILEKAMIGAGLISNAYYSTLVPYFVTYLDQSNPRVEISCLNN